MGVQVKDGDLSSWYQVKNHLPKIPRKWIRMWNSVKQTLLNENGHLPEPPGTTSMSPVDGLVKTTPVWPETPLVIAKNYRLNRCAI